MLAATEVVVLGEQLRPPDGYEADAVIAATYSLDLLVALGLPVSLVRGGRFAGETAETADRLTVLEAIRRLSPRYRVFCDASGLLPTVQRREFALLGRVIVPVEVPRRVPGSRPTFHPKFVLVRYAKRGAPPAVRLVCMSRNLTGDTALDVSVVLEGEVGKRTASAASSERMAVALERLLDWVKYDEQAYDSRGLVEDVAATIRRTKWHVPAGFRTVEVWPLGFDDLDTDPLLPRPDEQRMLVMSPFIQAGRLRAWSGGREVVLVSNSTALDALDASTLLDFEAVKTPDAMATDLHAKLYVAEGLRHRRWTIGSANATAAAVARNAELVVELTAGPSGPGINALLDDDTGVGSLLVDYAVPAQRPARPPESSRSEEIFQWLSASRFTGRVHPDEHATWTVEVHVDPPLRADDASIKVWLPDSAPQALETLPDPSATLVQVPRRSLSRYLRVSVQAEGEPPHERLVVMALEGADIDDLAEEALVDALRDPDSPGPLAYLRHMLLGTSPGAADLTFEEEGQKAAEGPASGSTSPGSASADFAILEPILQALELRDPDEAIIADLTHVVRSFYSELPGDFLELWEVIHKARERTGRR